MRSLITLFSLLFVAATSLFANAIRVSHYRPHARLPAKSSPEDAMTNAQRFARGLPPKSPHFKKGSPVRAPRTEPSPVSSTTTYRGHILVKDAVTQSELGYFGLSGGPGYGSIIASIVAANANPFTVTFTLPNIALSGGGLNAVFENSPFDSSWPDLGLIVAPENPRAADIGPGSGNYLFFGPTATTNYGSTPQSVGNSIATFFSNNAASESAVWTFNTITNYVSVQWINSDGSTPAMQFSVFNGWLVATGDLAKFSYNHQVAPVEVVFQFVPI